ncbi:MAG: 23S rRNA (pseudouridine(1915)-N(3))-methyltransferase RlmH [bacterium]|nr:23S rRNA (pseudouridine(1915)-N(3))-methyltransferase RlmH [bacterium]
MGGLSIRIACVGKIKEAFFRDAVAEYVKRLGAYCKLTVTEVADEKTKEHASETEEQLVKEKEAKRILGVIKDTDYVVALAIEGKNPDSVTLAEHIERLAIQGNSTIVFVIGGSLGLHQSVLKRADELLSFSAMTFPHQLMRVILLEQLYRSFRIQNHEPYHK